MSYIRDSKPMQGNESETRAQKLKRITGFSVEESDDILAFLKYLIKLCPAEHWDLYLKLCEGFIYADIDIRSLSRHALTQRNRTVHLEFEVCLTGLLPGYRVKMSLLYQTRSNAIVSISGDVSIEAADKQKIDVTKRMEKRDCIKLLQLFKVPLKYDGIDKVIKE